MCRERWKEILLKLDFLLFIYMFIEVQWERTSLRHDHQIICVSETICSISPNGLERIVRAAVLKVVWWDSQGLIQIMSILIKRGLVWWLAGRSVEVQSRPNVRHCCFSLAFYLIKRKYGCFKTIDQMPTSPRNSKLWVIRLQDYLISYWDIISRKVGVLRQHQLEGGYALHPMAIQRLDIDADPVCITWAEYLLVSRASQTTKYLKLAKLETYQAISLIHNNNAACFSNDQGMQRTDLTVHVFLEFRM